MLMALPMAAVLVFIAWWLIRRMFPSDTKTLLLEIEGEFERSRDAHIFYGVFIVTVLLWMTESFHGVTSSIIGFISS